MFQRHQITARVITAITAFTGAGFAFHCLWYALPKFLKSSNIADLPWSYSFWDRTNFRISLVVSFVVALIAAWLLWRPRPYPKGSCPRCGYDLRGSIHPHGCSCPECGYTDDSEIGRSR